MASTNLPGRRHGRAGSTVGAHGRPCRLTASVPCRSTSSRTRMCTTTRRAPGGGHRRGSGTTGCPQHPRSRPCRSIVPVMLRAAERSGQQGWLPDYADPGNIEGTVTTSLNLGGVRTATAGSRIGIRRYYTGLAVKVLLDGGYFGSGDDPAWMPESIAWTPTPVQSSGDRAFYDVTFDANGLCWLNSDPGTVVDPNVGFRVRGVRKGHDRTAVQRDRTAGTHQRRLPAVDLNNAGVEDPEVGVAGPCRNTRLPAGTSS